MDLQSTTNVKDIIVSSDVTIDTYEIIVWCIDQKIGHRFVNQSELTIEYVMRCVDMGRSFGLYRSSDSMVVFGRGKVINVQITRTEKGV